MSEIIRSNIMQRLYDALPEWTALPDQMLTVGQLSASLHFSAETIREALRRLRRLRCTKAACVDDEWRYGRRKSAVRPADSRGRKRR